jgi:hypothetical protein
VARKKILSQSCNYRCQKASQAQEKTSPTATLPVINLHCEPSARKKFRLLRCQRNLNVSICIASQLKKLK